MRPPQTMHRDNSQSSILDTNLNLGRDSSIGAYHPEIQQIGDARPIPNSHSALEYKPPKDPSMEAFSRDYNTVKRLVESPMKNY